MNEQQFNRSGKKIQMAKEPEQLKMFMSSREIEAKWQPLDGDRQDFVDEGTSGNGYTRTGGTLSSTYQDPPKTDTQGAKARRKWSTPGGQGRAYAASNTPGKPWGEQRLSMKKVYKQGVETDEQLWDRKADEAYSGDIEVSAKRANSYTMRSATTGGRSNQPMGTHTANTYEQPQGAHFRHDQEETLGESIERTGVQKPVGLGRTIGSQGKPEIVAGHHRMAVMRNLNQDQLMPVLHHDDIFSARSSQTEAAFGKYT